MSLESKDERLKRIFGNSAPSMEYKSYVDDLKTSALQKHALLEFHCGSFRYDEEPITRMQQEGIIDGLQAFASVEDGPGVCNFNVVRNFHSFMRAMNSPYMYEKMSRLFPNEYSYHHNLDNPQGVALFMLMSRMYFDKLDVTNNPFFALCALNLAEKLRADSDRYKALKQGIEESSKVLFVNSQIQENKPDKCEIAPDNLFRIGRLFTFDCSDFLKIPPNSKEEVFPDQVKSMSFFMDHEPLALADALERFGNASLTLTHNKFAKLVGRPEIPVPNFGGAFKPISFYDFCQFIGDNSEEVMQSKENEFLSMSCAMFTHVPSLLPYLPTTFFKKPIYNKFFFGSHALAYQPYWNFDVNTLYDVIPFSASYDPQLENPAGMHEYAKKNLTYNFKTMALDILYNKKGKEFPKAGYFGLNNGYLKEQEALKKATPIALSVLYDEAMSLGVAGVNPNSPLHTCWQQNRWIPFRDEAERQTFVKYEIDSFLYNPDIVKLAKKRLEADKQREAAQTKHLRKFLPILLYGMQKSIAVMPKDYSRSITDIEYFCSEKYEYNDATAPAHNFNLNR